MLLRIEEHLGIEHVLRCRLGEIGIDQIVEVLRLVQHEAALVEDRQEAWQVMVDITALHRRDIGIGQPDPVALGQGEFHLRLERSFEMNVKLGLGEGGDEGVDVGGHGHAP